MLSYASARYLLINEDERIENFVNYKPSNRKGMWWNQYYIETKRVIHPTKKTDAVFFLPGKLKQILVLNHVEL